jgi:hypothetical protein
MNIPEQLNQLWTLHQSGALTEHEFKSAKSQLIVIDDHKKENDIKLTKNIPKNNINTIFKNPPTAQIELKKTNKLSRFEIKELWSNDKDKYIMDFREDKYHFGEVWKDLEHIRVVYRNNRPLNLPAGIQRGYKMWLDSDNVIHIAHGHQNVNNISHHIMVDNYTKKDWECNCEKLSESIILDIYQHFDMI